MGVVGSAAGELRARAIHFADQLRIIETVFPLGDGRAGERVGGDDVGAGQQIGQVQLDDRVGLGQHQQIVVAGQRGRMIDEAGAAQVGLRRLQSLELCARRAVEHEDPVCCCGSERDCRAHATAVLDEAS